MQVYHGGYTPIKSPKIIEGRYAEDFGTGFYCTELKEQAIRWAKRYETPIVSVYEYQANISLNLLLFGEMTEQWLDFVVKSRNGEKHNHDIVSGPMANDQIYNYVSDYINGVLTREQFWVLAKFKKPTHQICFCTENALQYITYFNSKQYER